MYTRYALFLMELFQIFIKKKASYQKKKHHMQNIFFHQKKKHLIKKSIKNKAYLVYIILCLSYLNCGLSNLFYNEGYTSNRAKHVFERKNFVKKFFVVQSQTEVPFVSGSKVPNFITKRNKIN